MRRAALICALVAVLAQAGVATASWRPAGGGSGSAKAKQMPGGNQPTASVSNRDVAVSWTASSFSDGANVSGYSVKRYDTNGTAQSIAPNCSGTVSGLSCTEGAVPSGTWKYSVTPKQGSNWSGAESLQSATVTVGSPNLSFTSPTTVTSLPTTLNGNIANFISGQTVIFKLDNPSTGTALTGSITPSPVPSNGNASVTVTIPNGTANGSHTVYAIGSQGDQASAAITVNVPVVRSVTTPSWTVSDQSGAATDTSDQYAAAGGPYDFQLGFQASFATNRYLAFNFNDPLRAGLSTSGVNFNFDYVGTNSTGGSPSNTCFYFEVRRISTGNVLATHGSAASPVDCHNVLAFKQTSTALPEVNSTDIANDIQIRVYMNNAAGTGYTFEDQATVTGSEGSNSFTLYETQRTNQASGTPTVVPWSLNASADGSVYTSSANWATAFSATKYLKSTFPAYVPSTATGISATFKHSYKSNTSGDNTCWYFEVYNGATLLATHGSAATPVSCNSTTSFVTDTVSLPEVDNVTKANNVVIRIYAKNSGARLTQHDLATVKVDYTVGSPTPNLSFTSSTTVTSLPTTLNGDIANFISGQTVTFRLDDPSTGTVLSGSITPSPVPANGNASVSVTIPNGTSDGSHTVYAVGSQGDVASAAITVNVAVAQTFTTSAWTVSDQADTTAADTSDPYAAAGGPYDFQPGFQPAFATNRYLEFDYNGPLRAGFSTSGVNFNFDYVGTNSTGGSPSNTCFYFEVRRISTGNVLATHGSAASPVDCHNVLAFKQTSTALPEVNSTEIANDLRIRVFMSNADGAGYITEDRATVAGSQGTNAFTLFETQRVNQASGTPTTVPWSLNASADGAVFTSTDWATTFSTSRYLKLTYPAYVPSTATGISATFKHEYKSNTSATTSCWYFEVYDGATLIGTHGSAATPVSCNATTAFTTDTVSLPEVNTVAKANNVVIRIYATNSSGTSTTRKTLHDLATVKVDYSG